MRTTVTIDDTLLEKAKNYSGIEKLSDLLEMSLQSYISSEAARRLSALGGSDPFAEAAPRRRRGPVNLFTKEPVSSIVAEPGLDETSQES